MSESGSEAGESSFDHVDDMSAFRPKVYRYLKLPEEIEKHSEPLKQLKEEIAQLKAEQVELAAHIQQFMKEANINRCNIPPEEGGGVLELKASTTTPAVKKDNYKRGIESFLKKRGINATYEDVEKEIDETRETVTKNTLKRVKK